MQPPSKIIEYKCKNVIVSIPICEIKIKKDGIAHQIFKNKKKVAGAKESPHLTGGPRPRLRSVGRERTQKIIISWLCVCILLMEAGGGRREC
jgi:hypothetical protein